MRPAHMFQTQRFRAAAAFLFMSTMAVADDARAGLTGEIQGYVVDDAGLPVVGAKATVSAKELQGTQSTFTDIEGTFRFAQLPPGFYTVRLEHPQFETVVETGISVTLDSVVLRDYLLVPASGKPGEEAKVIEVVAESTGVDTTRVQRGASIRPSQTDRLVTTRSYQGMAFLVPGVVDDSPNGAQGNPSMHGGTGYSNQYYLDGINITDPVTGTFSTNFNFDAIQETQIITGGMDAEYGQSTGGVINIVTKSGGDEFTFDGSAYWSPSQLQLLDPGEINDSNDISANIAVGGPIIRKKLWFFVSGQYVDNTTTTPLEQQVFSDVPVMPARNFRGVYGMGKLRWQPVDWQRFTLVLQADPSWITNEEQDPLRHPDAERQRYQGGLKIGFTSETRFGENVLWKTQLAYAGDRLEIFPMSNDRDTPGRENLETGTYTVNDSFYLDDNRHRAQLQTSASYFLDNFFGDHEFKAGIDAQLTWNTVYEDRSGKLIYYDRGISQTTSTLGGAGDPHQVAVYDQPLEKFTWGNAIGLYVQDVWRPFKNLTIRPGVRFDSSRAYNDPSDGGAEIFNFNYPSPRIGAAWDPFSDGKTVIRGGYYQYAEVGMLLLPGFVGRGLQNDVYEYNPATGAYDIYVRTEGGDDSVVYKDNMRPPVMHEAVFGFSRQLFEDATAHVDFTYRRKNNMFEDDEVNVIWNEDGSNAVGYRNGSPNYIFSLGTPDEAFNEYIGVDLAFEKRLADNWSLTAMYTLSRLTGTVENLITYSLDNPRQREYEYGFLENDVRHNARLFVTYELPYGVQTGLSASYASGRPYSKLFLNNYYNAYLDRRAPRGYDPRDLDDPTDDVELRYPDNFRVNLRLVWSLQELTGQNIWLIGEVVNLLNQRPTTLVEERNLTSGDVRFGQALQRGAPMNGTLGLRYQF